MSVPLPQILDEDVRPSNARYLPRVEPQQRYANNFLKTLKNDIAHGPKRTLSNLAPTLSLGLDRVPHAGRRVEVVGKGVI